MQFSSFLNKKSKYETLEEKKNSVLKFTKSEYHVNESKVTKKNQKKFEEKSLKVKNCSKKH